MTLMNNLSIQFNLTPGSYINPNEKFDKRMITLLFKKINKL